MMMLDMQQKLHCCEKLQKKAINSATAGELRSSWLSSARRIVKGDKLSPLTEVAVSDIEI